MPVAAVSGPQSAPVSVDASAWGNFAAEADNDVTMASTGASSSGASAAPVTQASSHSSVAVPLASATGAGLPSAQHDFCDITCLSLTANGSAIATATDPLWSSFQSKDQELKQQARDLAELEERMRQERERDAERLRAEAEQHRLMQQASFFRFMFVRSLNELYVAAG